MKGYVVLANCKPFTPRRGAISTNFQSWNGRVWPSPFLLERKEPRFESWFRDHFFRGCNLWTAKQHRELRRDEAIVYLGGKCRDCGNFDKRVLEFHHSKERRNNGLTVAALFQGSWERLRKVLDVCELLCANCHKIKTLQQ